MKQQKMKLIISYSEEASQRVRRDTKQYPHFLVNQSSYNIFPFEDQDYRNGYSFLQRRYGFIAFPVWIVYELLVVTKIDNRKNLCSFV